MSLEVANNKDSAYQPGLKLGNPVDFAKGLWQGAAEDPVRAVAQLANHSSSQRTDDQNPETLTGKAGKMFGTVADFVLLAKAAEYVPGVPALNRSSLGSAAKLGSIGCIYGGLLTPSPDDNNLASDRLKTAFTSGLSFGVMGGVGKFLEPAPQIAKNLATNIKIGAISGAAGGFASTLGTSAMNSQLESWTQFASSTAQNAAFGAIFGAGSHALDKSTGKLTDRPIGDKIEIPVIRKGQRASVNDRAEFAANDPLVKLYENSKNSVVSVAGGKQINDFTCKFEWSGTGFVVKKDSGLIATADHVIHNLEQVQVHINGRWEAARVIARDQPHDVALVQIGDTTLLAGMKDVPIANYSRGNRHVAVIGYPLGNPPEVSPLVASPGKVLRSSTYKPQNGTYQHGAASLDISAHLAPGQSGSPVLNRDGAAVAIACKALHFKEGFHPLYNRNLKGYGISSQYLVELLKKSDGNTLKSGNS